MEKNKKSKAFLEVLSEGGRILPPSLVKYEIASKTDQANWGHPQVAINVAQWISPEFDVKVSKWVFELMVTGQVTLGQEKTPQQLELKYQEQLQNLQLQLTQSEEEKFKSCTNITRGCKNINTTNSRKLDHVSTSSYKD